MLSGPKSHDSLFSSHPCPSVHPCTRPFANVRGVLAFPLPAGIDPRCAFTESPLNFRDLTFRPDVPKNMAYIHGFQLGISLLQCHTLGTPPLADKVVDALESYDDLYGAMFDKKTGNPIVRNFISAKQDLAFRGSTLYKPRNGNTLHRLYNGGEGRSHIHQRHKASYQEALDAENVRIPGQAGVQTATNFFQAAFGAAAAANAPAPSVAPVQDNSRAWEVSVREGSEKVSVVLVRFPDRRHTSRCAGCILYVLVHDPLWNPGAGIDTLLNLSTQTGRGRAIKTHIGAQVAQVGLYDPPSTHVLNGIDAHRYHLICANYLSRPLAQEDIRGFAEEDHPLHPFNIWTPARALAALREASPNANIDAVAGSPDGPDCRYPLMHRAAPLHPHFPYVQSARLPADYSYEMLHRRTFWRHERDAGLVDQFLPWEDGHVAITMHDPVTGHAVPITTRPSGDTNHAATDARSAGAQLQQTDLPRLCGTARGSLAITRDQLNWGWAAEQRYDPLRRYATSMQPEEPMKTSEFTDEWLAKHTQYASDMNALETRLADLFVARVWTSDARHPDTFEHLIRWHLHGKHANSAPGPSRPGFTHIRTKTPFINKRLSPFANTIQQRAFKLRFVRRVANNIREALALLISVFDAYNPAPGMSTNALHSGEAGSGKSFLLDLIELLLLPGTVIRINSQSARAENVFKDSQGSVRLYDEAPSVLLSNKQGAPAKDGGHFVANLKSLLTGSPLVHIVPRSSPEGVVDRNGQLVVISWFNRSMMAVAMNNPLCHLENAVRSRFMSWPHYDWDVGAGPTPGPGAAAVALPDDNDGDSSALTISGADSIAGQTSSNASVSIMEMNMAQNGYSESRIANDVKKEHWVKQVLIALGNKLIQAKALPEIDMRVCDYVCFKMLSFMKRHSSISIASYRKYERVRNVARQLTLENAIEMVFHNPYDHASAHDGLPGSRPFETRDVMRIKPYLVCQIEQAVFAFTLYANQWLNPFDAAVVRSMLEYVEFPVADQHAFLTEQHALATAQRKTGDAAIVALGDGHASFAARHYITHTSPMERSLWATRLDETTGKTFVNLDYIVFRGGMRELVRDLYGVMQPRPSKELIQSALTLLTERMVEVPSHDPIAEDQLTSGIAPAMHMRRIHVVTERMQRGTEREILVSPVALEYIATDTLITRAVQSLAYRGLKPRTLVLGTLANRTNGTFNTVDITQSHCDSGPAALTFSSADYMSRFERAATFGTHLRQEGSHQFRTLGDNVAQTEAERAANVQAVQEEVMEAASAAIDGPEAQAQMTAEDQDFDAMLKSHLNPGRTDQTVRITEDIDDWVVRSFMARNGVPMCRHPDYPRNTDLQWLYTARDGTRLRRPLPTNRASHAETVRQVQQDKRERTIYNSAFTNFSAEEKRLYRLGRPPAIRPSPISMYVDAAATEMTSPGSSSAFSSHDSGPVRPSVALRRYLNGSEGNAPSPSPSPTPTNRRRTHSEATRGDVGPSPLATGGHAPHIPQNSHDGLSNEDDYSDEQSDQARKRARFGSTPLITDVAARFTPSATPRTNTTIPSPSVAAARNRLFTMSTPLAPDMSPDMLIDGLDMSGF